MNKAGNIAIGTLFVLAAGLYLSGYFFLYFNHQNPIHTPIWLLWRQQGVILSAPPRAGKGVEVVIPNLLNFPGSVIVLDVKRENWEITAGFRQQHGQQVFMFDPLSETGDTVRWNPPFYVSEDPNNRINDIQRNAEMLYQVEPGKDAFWALSSRTLFLGVGLYLFETPHATRTLGEVLRQGMSGDTIGDGFLLPTGKTSLMRKTYRMISV
jgi:type IV secretion system protein VirD4